MKKLALLAVTILMSGSLMAQGMMAGGNDKGLWLSGNAGLIIPFNNGATGSGFNFYVDAEYPSLFMAGPLAVNAGAELGIQIFGEGDGGVSLTQIPVNLFVNTDVGSMIGDLPVGIQPLVGFGLFSASDNIDGSAMPLGLFGGLGVTYPLSDEMRVGGQFRGYRVLGFATSEDPNDFFNITLKFDYFLPL